MPEARSVHIIAPYLLRQGTMTHSVSAAETSNQDLYELVLNMRTAALQLPAIQRAAVQPLDLFVKTIKLQARKCLFIVLSAIGVATVSLLVLYISRVASWHGSVTILGAMVVIGEVLIALVYLHLRSRLLAEINRALESMSIRTSSRESVGLDDHC